MGIYNQVGDDTIQVKAILSPIDGKAIPSNSYIVYFGATVDSLSIVVHNESILVQNPSTSIAVTVSKCRINISGHFKETCLTESIYRSRTT